MAINTSSSSAEISDVSFAGSSITLSGGVSCTITQFMDDANPVEFPDAEVTTAGVNCNGKMIRNAKPNLIMMSVTVIPGSDNDKALYEAWKKYRVEDAKNDQGTWTKALTATVKLGNSKSSMSNYKYQGGTMIGGPGGPSSSAEGKMQGRTYTFAFAKGK